MNRSLTLAACEYWYRGERYGIEKLTQGAAFFEPLFVYRSGCGTAVYYDFSDVQQDPRSLAASFNDNKEDFDEDRNMYEEKVVALLRLTNSPTTNIQELFDAIVSFWPYLTVMNVLGGLAKGVISDDMQKKALELRTRTDTVIYQAGARFEELFIRTLPDELKSVYDVVSYDEVINKTFLSVDDYKERQKGYCYSRGKVKTETIDDCARTHNIVFAGESIQEDVTILKGFAASKGVVQGRVKVLFEWRQGAEVLPGDILVASMTTPDFLPAMERAAGFVTDEGGITCHAAIIARELKKPCVIGTKIATQVLKDGDMVEVDAEKGIVRVLSSF